MEITILRMTVGQDFVELCDSELFYSFRRDESNNLLDCDVFGEIEIP